MADVNLDAAAELIEAIDWKKFQRVYLDAIERGDVKDFLEGMVGVFGDFMARHCICARAEMYANDSE